MLQGNYVRGAQVSFLIEGVDVQGTLVLSGNVSYTPGLTDWPGSHGCTFEGVTNSWGTIDFDAYNPAVSGWTSVPIHCEG